MNCNASMGVWARTTAGANRNCDEHDGAVGQEFRRASTWHAGGRELQGAVTSHLGRNCHGHREELQWTPTRYLGDGGMWEDSNGRQTPMRAGIVKGANGTYKHELRWR